MHDAEPTLEASFNRVLTAAGRLSESLQDLGDAGGIESLRGKMRPATLERLAVTLRQSRAAIDEQLRRLPQRPRTHQR